MSKEDRDRVSGARRGDRFEGGWRARFNRYALLHDDEAGIAGWSPTGLQARFRFFRRHFGDDPGSGVWLDVGCGAGTYTHWLAERGVRSIGIDYSVPSVSKARARGNEGPLWLVADARRLPVEPGSAAGVLCFGVTQALSESGALVEELVRSLRAGGVVWIDGLNSWCLPHAVERLKRWLRGHPPHTRYESPWRLRRLVRGAGMTEVRLLWLPILPRRLQRLQPALEHPWTVAVFAALPLLGALASHSMVVTARRQA